jgi:hypothetical protein
MRLEFLRRKGAVLIVAGALLATASGISHAQEISAAEKLLFLTNHFMSGVHEIPIPSIDHAQGNPAILGFLERDIAEMKRLTGGATGYFRKRIRLALAAPVAAVKKIEVGYDGKQVAAQEVTIYPYRDDPLKDRFGKFADKGYVFVVSDAVPGSLYRVYTTLNPDKAAPALDASMTIARGDAGVLKTASLVLKKK